MAKILYGVQGEGRGHATRSLRVLQALIREGHEVLVLSGGDALPVLGASLGNRVIEIPLLRYHYNPRGSLCALRTLLRNAGPFCKMAFRNPSLEAAVRRFGPVAAISDFEPLTCRLARVFKLPLLAVDHQHFLTETLLPRVPGARNASKLFAYRLGTQLLSGWPRRMVVSSFHHFPRLRGSRAVFVGPFLPEDVRRISVRDAGHITVYLKRPHYLKGLLPVLTSTPGRNFELFAAWDQEWTETLPRNVKLRALSREDFLRSLASAHALVTTAGNQVLGEAIWLGKPALALPEPGVLEQEFNARALEDSGCGAACAMDGLTQDAWNRFEENRGVFLRGIRTFRETHPDYDGLGATLQAIRRLVNAPENSPMPGTTRRDLTGTVTAASAWP